MPTTRIAKGPVSEMDFVPILKALHDVDYRGWVSVEVFEFGAGPERIARESIQYLKRCERAEGR